MPLPRQPGPPLLPPAPARWVSQEEPYLAGDPFTFSVAFTASTGLANVLIVRMVLCHLSSSEVALRAGGEGEVGDGEEGEIAGEKGGGRKGGM